MAVRIVIGAQWGDEGKGKIVDLLSSDADFVVRYQGGANAGHTLKFDDTVVVLHLIPSGMFNGNSACIIGNGVVIDPIALMKEIKEVEAMGVNLKDRLFISSSAHLILPYHKTLDRVKEARRGNDPIGTTGRGIGPAYVSKLSRVGIRMNDLLHQDLLEEKIKRNLEDINRALERVYQDEPMNADEIIRDLQESVEYIKPYICNTADMLHKALDEGKSILLEGAQGTLLDVDHGTYPYVPLLTRQLEVPVRAAEFLQWLLPILPVLPKPIVPGWGMGHSRLNWRMVMERSSAKTVRSLEPQQAGPGDADGWIWSL